jgi:Domain of unknown function (DUF1840)
MIVTFSTKRGQLTMQGEPAVRLLVLGGHSGTVPGAILATDLAAFLARLRAALVTQGGEISPALPADTQEPDDRDEDSLRERPVSLHHRAVPFLQLLDTAIANRSDLMWDRA